jgi:hypothetical protein
LEDNWLKLKMKTSKKTIKKTRHFILDDSMEYYTSTQQRKTKRGSQYLAGWTWKHKDFD